MDLWQTLPQDFRVTTFICLGGIGFLLALYLIGRVLTWRRPQSALPFLMVVAGVVVIMGGISLYLDRQPTLPGIVVTKTEQIEVDSEGNWSHALRVRVTYTPPGASEPRDGDLSADAAVYDRVSLGDQVDVRFLHLGGYFAFARLSDRSTLSILLGGRWWSYVFPISLALLLLIGVMAHKSKHTRLYIVLIAALAAFAFLINYVPQWRAAWPLTGAQATAVATVREVTHFTEVGGSDESEPEPLLQPFDLVQVEFVPEERRDPVMGADMIDAGSLRLETGGTVPVRYLVDDPRTIRLEGGARTYVWKNTLWSIATLAFIVLLLAALILGERLIRRRLRSQPEA